MPTVAESLNLAEQALAAGDSSRAGQIFEQILAAVPGQPAALNGLGVVAFRAGRLDEAEQFHRRAIAGHSDNPAFFNNLNLVLCSQGRPREAIECCRRALALAPDSPLLHNNLGIALKQACQLDAAVTSFHRAVTMAPDYADAHFNLANGLVLERKLDEAENEFRRALELAPGDADTHFNHGLLRLLRGDFAEGWREFEWRWGLSEFSRPNFSQPAWRGESLANRTLLLVGEQGLGDMIQMIRFAPLVKQPGTTLLVQCRPGMRELLSTAPGVDRCLSPGETVPFDFHFPLLSLPGVLGTRLESIPAEVPYLFADPARVEHWRPRLTESPGFKVGISWQGRPTYKLDHYRSIPLAEFAPLGACPGVQFFSLQKGHGREQLAAPGQRLQIVDLGASLDKDTGAVADTPAVMKSLDLVITSDTAIAHLAGALGVPVWVALSFGADWRWLLDRDDCPWYPTMRLFRQTKWGDWPGVFRRIADELQVISTSAQ